MSDVNKVPNEYNTAQKRVHHHPENRCISARARFTQQTAMLDPFFAAHCPVIIFNFSAAAQNKLNLYFELCVLYFYKAQSALALKLGGRTSHPS